MISPTRLLLCLQSKTNNDQRAWGMIENTLYNKIVQKSVLESNRIAPLVRARTLLKRWTPLASAGDAEHLLRLSRIIGKVAQPCIHAANLRTWRNGWVTARRMRTCDPTRQDICLFGCSPTARDCIEHYVHCKTLRNAGMRVLGKCSTRLIPMGIEQTILMKHAKDDEDIIFGAVWVYLIYSAYNDVRNSPQKNWNEWEIADLIRLRTRSLHGKARHNDWMHSASPN